MHQYKQHRAHHIEYIYPCRKNASDMNTCEAGVQVTFIFNPTTPFLPLFLLIWVSFLFVCRLPIEVVVEYTGYGLFFQEKPC
ncbi:hypothetical protein EON63_17625 [archaeon]|nr:MAG: hypothetical protein EON63_17625 [archaeon]